MSKSKSRKRKQSFPTDLPNKAVKTTATTITPPPDGAPIEPKTLQSVISEEELEITVDTLATLAKYPSLLKTKACKDLRVAVYDFRQACNTGVNSARTSLPEHKPHVYFPGHH